jgi:hypothetical protein
MLRRKHVLVLGAWASVDYDFPTGLQLCERVNTSLMPNNAHLKRFLEAAGVSAATAEAFRKSLFYSAMNSVDRFLEHRPDMNTVGKAAIAYCLAQCETGDRLFRHKDNWLRDLYSRIDASKEGLKDYKLSIITFNYDRCVEFFLHTALRYTHDCSDEHATDLLAYIPIIHLHGQLGYLPWQGKPNEDTRRFSQEVNHHAIEASVRNIKIIHEGTEDRDVDFKRAKKLLQDSERILFLGFGYHPVNLDRLGIKELGSKKIFGSCVSLGNQEKSRIADYFRGCPSSNALRQMAV